MSIMADDDRREDRGFPGGRRDRDEMRGRFRPEGEDQGGQRSGRRAANNDREGFWGRGHSGSGFERDERRDYSREDYGVGQGGAPERGGSYAGSFSRTGEEGRGGQGYGWQRGDFGREASGRNFAGNGGRGFGYGRDERGFFERATDEVSSWFGDQDAERRREQDYRGRGPKGYKRSDSRVQEDVNDRLTDDPHLDASDVEVAVAEGEVTLTGLVDGRQARRRAENLAEQVSGVTYVQNNLRVRSPA
jgi:osmotically-inducible protein OsmY